MIWYLGAQEGRTLESVGPRDDVSQIYRSIGDERFCPGHKSQETNKPQPQRSTHPPPENTEGVETGV